MDEKLRSFPSKVNLSYETRGASPTQPFASPMASTTGTSGRPKLLAEIYGVYKRREAYLGLIPGTGQGAIRSWSRISPDDRILDTSKNRPVTMAKGADWW